MKVSPHVPRIKEIAVGLIEQGCIYAPDRLASLKGWRLTNFVSRAVGAAVEAVKEERRIKQPLNHRNFNHLVRIIIEERKEVLR